MEPKLDLPGSIPVINLQEPDDTITLSSTTYRYPYGYDYANVSLASSGSNTSNTSGAISGGISAYSNSTGIASPTWVTAASPWLGNGIGTDPNGSGKLKLNGDGADIEINGESLMSLMKEIRERLNLFTLNEKMEKEWDELKALGEQYRALEAKLKEQGEMWEKLKAMPPPDIG